MLFRVFLVSAAIAFSTASTQAQSTGSWTGFNLAIGGGAAKVDANMATLGTFNSSIVALGLPPGDVLAITGTSLDRSSLPLNDWRGFVTFGAGYDQKVGSFVFGILGDFDLYPDHASKSETHNFLTTISVVDIVGGVPANIPDDTFVNGSVTTKLKVENVWSIGGRVGYLPTPNLLLYGLAGYTQMSFDSQSQLTFQDFGPAGSIDRTLVTKMSDELDGYFIGVGSEWKMSEACALRLEYRYADYNGKAKTTGFTSAELLKALPASIDSNGSLQSKVEMEQHSVRAALVLKLGAEDLLK